MVHIVGRVQVINCGNYKQEDFWGLSLRSQVFMRFNSRSSSSSQDAPLLTSTKEQEITRLVNGPFLM